MSEKITAVKLKENISKNPFYSCLKLKLKLNQTLSILTSDLVPGAGHLTKSTAISKVQMLGVCPGDMLKFQIDRYIIITKLLFLYNRFAKGAKCCSTSNYARNKEGRGYM